MIKNFMFPTVIGLTALIAYTSYAEDKNYVQLSTGYSFAKSTGADVEGKKPKRGNVHSIELGRAVTDRVKIGLEFSHRSGYSVSDHSDAYDSIGDLLESQSEKWSYKSSAVMVNVRCDLANLSGFTPYLLVGAGVAQNKMKDDFSRSHIFDESTNSIRSNKSKNFAYKVGAGVSYAVSKKIGIDIRYQFVNLGKARLHQAKDSQGELLSATRGRLKTKEVLVGISYKF